MKLAFLCKTVPKASLRMLANRGGKCFILLSVGSEVKMVGVCRKATLTHATYGVMDVSPLSIIVTITMFMFIITV